MIALLNCGISWSRTPPSTGDVTDDSVLVSINDIRVANSKMIELSYEKEINKNLRETIKLDSCYISELKESLYMANQRCQRNVKEIKRHRNILLGTNALTILLLVLSLL